LLEAQTFSEAGWNVRKFSETGRFDSDISPPGLYINKFFLYFKEVFTMIKKLQALRAKKGFTLVELIVVIAIIGVLAAILVPTMMGMVTKSRVTSANTTADGFADTIQQFLTDADTAGKGMLKGVKANARFDIEVDGDGKWTIVVTANGTNTFKDQTTEWTVGASAIDPDGTTTMANGKKVEQLALTLADRFPTMKNACCVCYVSKATPVFTLYTADSADADDLIVSTDVPLALVDGAGASAPADKSFAAPVGFEWDGKTEGVSTENGFIVGTAPAIPFGTLTGATP